MHVKMIGNTLIAIAGLLHLTHAVPYGLQIYSCTMPGVIAPGFDDGPWIYSEDILDRMQAAGVKATWFINGANKGNIYDYNSTLRRMINIGHQIGSHTWSHKDLASLTADGVRQEMLLLEEAMTNILGYFPYYMRPPFLSVNANALQVLKDLEYHVIIGDLNTKDWEYQSETGIEKAKKLFTDGLDMGYTIVEAHEQEPWSHGVLIDYMIEVITKRGLKTVTVAECLQDAQLYRSVREPGPTNVTSSVDPGPTVVYSLNGRCGNINAGNNSGWTCPPNGGRCCSKYGNCGSGPDYCAYNVCQPAFGLCSPAPSSSSYRDEALHSNTGTVIPSRTVSATEFASATTTGSKAAASSLGPGSITPDGTCGNVGSGKNKGYICKTGQCCSRYGNCGITSDYCSSSVCQSAFGKCDATAGRGSISPDSTCGDVGKGGNNGYVCKTGQCCSKFGNCGTTNDYCAASLGCQSAFGVCAGVVSSSVKSATPTPPANNAIVASATGSSAGSMSVSPSLGFNGATSTSSSVIVSGTANAALNAPASSQSSVAILSVSSTVSSGFQDQSTTSQSGSSSINAPAGAALKVAPTSSSNVVSSLGSTTIGTVVEGSSSASNLATAKPSSSIAADALSASSAALFSDAVEGAIVSSSSIAVASSMPSSTINIPLRSIESTGPASSGTVVNAMDLSSSTAAVSSAASSTTNTPSTSIASSSPAPSVVVANAMKLSSSTPVANSLPSSQTTSPNPVPSGTDANAGESSGSPVPIGSVTPGTSITQASPISVSYTSPSSSILPVAASPTEPLVTPMLSSSISTIGPTTVTSSSTLLLSSSLSSSTTFI